MRNTASPLDQRAELFKLLLSRAHGTFEMTAELVRVALGVSGGEAFMELILAYHCASYERFKIACPAKGERVGLKKAPLDANRSVIADFVGVSSRMAVLDSLTDLYEKSGEVTSDDLLCQWPSNSFLERFRYSDCLPLFVGLRDSFFAKYGVWCPIIKLMGLMLQKDCLGCGMF